MSVVPKATDVNLTAMPVPLTTAWLAQLAERQSAVRDVDGLSPRLDQHSESENTTEENVLPL